MIRIGFREEKISKLFSFLRRSDESRNLDDDALIGRTRLIRNRFPKNLQIWLDKIANAIIRDLFPKNLQGWDEDKWIFTTLVYYLAYYSLYFSHA